MTTTARPSRRKPIRRLGTLSARPPAPANDTVTITIKTILCLSHTYARRLDLRIDYINSVDIILLLLLLLLLSLYCVPTPVRETRPLQHATAVSAFHDIISCTTSYNNGRLRCSASNIYKLPFVTISWCITVLDHTSRYMRAVVYVLRVVI